MSSWYYAKQGQHVGPIDDQSMKNLLANGTILPTDLVWCEGMPQWSPAGTIPQFAQILNQQPSPGLAYPATQPINYGSVPNNPRPTSVTVIAIIGIVLGSIGLLGSLCGLIAIAGFSSNPAFKDAVAIVPFPWLIISTVLSIVMVVLLLIASIQALKLIPWARKGLVTYAVMVLILGAVNLAITLASTSSSTAAVQQILSTVAGFIFGSIFAICILIFMTRPQVIAAFENNRR